ncbi:DUF488 domain-containing protein [Mycolicibacterium goodii]|uniref:DUF488 domain-containing protein n=1 Tax=Mycolicibacterium goodii TaxID=134601 RepID=A0A0K0XCW1_MYCGD|nr:hypothetical protein AFA91_28505 [Mycolicibacterium goodii]
MAPKGEVRLARVYEEPEADEGHRVLVDRLWPRGLRKDDPRIGQWLPEVAPSNELRRWYGHAPERHAEFVQRYTAELDAPDGAAALDELRGIVRAGPVVLVTATKEIELSHLSVLARLLT